jgi:hypothetical protein
LPEQDESLQELMDARIGKAQARGALATYGNRVVDGLQGVFCEQTVVA